MKNLLSLSLGLILLVSISTIGNAEEYKVYSKDGWSATLPAPEKVPETNRAPSNGYWTPVFQDGFELYWPYDWYIYTESGAADCYWGTVSCRSWDGSWSAHCANDGSAAPVTACDGYVDDMAAWMEFGPFDISNATAGYITFYTWRMLEDQHDKFFYSVSIDGVDFYGTEVSSDTSGWENVSQPFSSVPILGNVLGSNAVWIAFGFSSDGTIVDGEGAYLDNVEVWIESNTPGRVRLVMPDTYFTPGDFVWLDAWYAEATNPSQLPLFVILEAYGSYYMGPSFSTGMDYYSVNPSQNFDLISPISNFYWPSGAGIGYGIKWYAALTDTAVTTVRSNIATWEFDFGN